MSLRLLMVLACCFSAVGLTPAQLPPMPPGGTVRALAADPSNPNRVLLGTTTGVVFVSSDAGSHWRFLARVAPHADWVVASLVADAGHPGHWFAGLWSWRSAAGGVFASDDDGAHWAPLWQGHPVRALAQAPSLPSTLVAATLDGVYSSQNGGLQWSLISPPHDRELSDIESVALDPLDPQTIYVGTWHLPWKTLNGGHDWWQMRDGVIDDSDVFSIAVDRRQPQTVYLSACSGIYRSDNKGALFRKLQGIPYSARRTPALVEDPRDPGTIYAGTTQGLWVSHDHGATWRLLTVSTLAVNSVVVLPQSAGPNTVLLGTEFAGVFRSQDGGSGFAPSNFGFANRQVTAIAPTPEGDYVAISGDQSWGGVFWHPRQGESWLQLSPLPHHVDPLDLHWSSAGLVAATAQGLFWQPSTPAPGRPWRAPSGAPSGAVNQLASLSPSSPMLFAAAADGLYRSADGGQHWVKLLAAPAPLYHALAVNDSLGARSWLFLAGDGYVIRSDDAGGHFIAGRLSLDTLGRIQTLAFAAPPGLPPILFAATTRGLFQSSDWGAHWSLSGHGLPAASFTAVYSQTDGIYVLGAEFASVFRSTDGGQEWQPIRLAPDLETWARVNPALLSVMPPAANAAPTLRPLFVRPHSEPPRPF